MSQIILASGSPRRRELLTTLGLPFTVDVSEASEHIDGVLPPSTFVETLAHRKAAAVSLRYADHDVIIVGSDTVVVLDGEILGKPSSKAHAEDMLTKLQGRTHEVYTGLCVMRSRDEKVVVRHSHTKVTMRPLSPEEISNYVGTGEPMDKAGAYAIQGIGSTIVTGIHGDYFTVVGLPLALLADTLKEFDVCLI